ncbi:MAG: hypothetical protein AAF311_13755 [Pseudomonadota bacterium]
MISNTFFPPVSDWNEVNALTQLLALDEGPRADAALELFLEVPHRPALLRDAWRMTYAHKPAFIYDRFDLEHDSAPKELAARIDMMEADRRVWGDDPLRAFLIAADFPRQTDLGDTVTIWRGLASPWEEGRLDLSWTLDRDTAAWFAMRRSGLRNAEPQVVRIEIPSVAILWRSDERGEAEVIPRLRKGGYQPETVGTRLEVEEWAEAQERRKAAAILAAEAEDTPSPNGAMAAGQDGRE